MVNPDETTHRKAYVKDFAHVRVDLMYARVNIDKNGRGFTLESEDLSESELSLVLSTGSYPVEYDENSKLYVNDPKGRVQKSGR